ncbi:MAG: DUF479 domain-containing protein [Desulfuromonas sp.]|uniref:acyl carrier protein phosphodiesterase n=1 Tax=Desulfuromonas sp. TaxID=892 RepID=UPI000CBF3F4D|nr:ACP phosphodiesterase [Desulfuromonas sp.]PLX86505.1 MAG: DUF479 domain-containing protein [Desulfuromonas sp.]
MNYLVHLYLSDPTPECLLGTLMGDFVKGRIGESFAPGVRRGIVLHRKVDVFAESHPAFRSSKGRICDSYGYFRGILVDIFYDHFMARNWERYGSEPLPEFARRVYAVLENHAGSLPAPMKSTASAMIAHNWLVSYREMDVIGRVLERVSSRLRRPNPLGLGLAELEKNYAGLEDDFRAFLPEAQDFVRCFPHEG